MKKDPIFLAVLACVAFAVAIGVAMAGDAQQQAATMKKKLAAGTGAVPTGYEVPGPTFYELTPNGVKAYSTMSSTRDAKRFYGDGARFGGGAGTAGSGGSQ